jgi:hypothetical protein
MSREEWESVSNGEVDYYDVGSMLGCDSTVIGGLGGGTEDVLEVLLVWSEGGLRSRLVKGYRGSISSL